MPVRQNVQKFQMIDSFFILSYDIASESGITPCITIDKPLVAIHLVVMLTKFIYLAAE